MSELGGQASWNSPLPLSDNTRYFWRAAADDGHTQGAWTTGSFFVNLGNDPPSAPILMSPVDGQVVTTATPTLRLHNSVDPDGDALTYEFEVSDPSGVVQTIDGIVSGASETSWPVPQPL